MKQKNITLNCYNIIGGVNKIMQSSKGLCEFIRIIELKIIIQGRIYNNIINIYLRSEKIPILSKKFCVKIANKRDNGLKSVNQQCCERHCIIYNFLYKQFVFWLVFKRRWLSNKKKSFICNLT